MEPRPFFELAGVTVTAGSARPLAGVDLRVARGELVAVVGPSGAGKTTLLSVLNATRRVSAGRVAVDGLDLEGAAWGEVRRTRSRVGFVHQSPALVPNLRVSQNVIAGRLGRRGPLAGLLSVVWPRAQDLEEAHRLLERVGIADKLFHRTDTLSGGELQRAAIARALFQEPEALLADEPVAAVDPARARDVIGLLVELAGEGGLALVASLHDLELARAFFPRCVGLRGGRVRFDSRTADLTEADFAELYRLEESQGPAPPRPAAEVATRLREVPGDGA